MRIYTDPFELEYTLNLYSTVTICFCIIYLLDTFISFVDKDIKRRWYVIHAIINFVILFLSFPDFLHTVMYPLDIVGYDIDFYPISFVIGLHLYHIYIDWRYMDIVDWMHHLISAFLVPNLVMYFIKGSLINYMLVFMCGFPGGIDYTILALTKYNVFLNIPSIKYNPLETKDLLHKYFGEILNKWKMNPRLEEKKLNTFLNNWIRAPGILHACSLGLINIAITCQTEFTYYKFFIGILLVILNYYNAVYFAERVTLNYGKRQIIEKYKEQIGNSEEDKYFN